MPLFSKHREIIYSAAGEQLRPELLETGEKVRGFSNRTGKPNRQPLAYVVTVDAAGRKRFTLKGRFS